MSLPAPNPPPTRPPNRPVEAVGRRLSPAVPARGHLSVALTYGTYDLFHIGHVRLFERIRQRFDRLVVAVSTDEFNAIKGKKAVVPYADRVAVVRACRYVDEVIAENDWDQKARDIAVHGVDAFVMGDDWQGRFDHLTALCEVLYLPRTEGVSTSVLKQQVIGATP